MKDIIYNVTVNVEEAIHDDWLQWMKEVHIPEVMRTGIFSENRIFKVLADEGTGTHTYAIQYICGSMEAYEIYRDNFSAAFQEQTKKRYQDKCLAFRTLLEVIR
jgi:hypothetical protein